MTEHIPLPHGLTAVYITHAAADAAGDGEDRQPSLFGDDYLPTKPQRDGDCT